MDPKGQSEIPLNAVPNTAISANNKRNMSHERDTCKSIRRYFRDYCDNSSIIGFKYLGEKRSRGERILWLILLLIAIALSIYYILEIYYKYEENPFIVNLATRESPIFSIPFPAVTICPAVKTERKYFNFSKAVQKIWQNGTLTDEEMRNTQYISLLCESLDDSYKNELTQNKTFNEGFYDQIEYLAPARSSIFFICLFMGNFEDCNDLFTPIVLDEGICYTFNMLDREYIYRDDVVHYSNYHKTENNVTWTINDGYSKGAGRNAYPKRALLAGANNGLDILLMQDSEDLENLCLNDAHGFSAVFHTPYMIPQLSQEYITIPLDTNVLAVIQPKMMTTSKEVKNYRPSTRLCYFSDERQLEYFKIYNPDNCRLECLTNFTLNKCGCVNFYMPRNNSTQICGNGMTQCLEDALYEMKEAEIENILKVDSDSSASCNCMPLCTELDYNAETARLYFPWREQFATEKKISEMLESLNRNLSKLHMSRLSVFFKRDHFQTSQRSELYGPFDFLANFGGIIGLFTGFSLLSAVEILYFVSVRLWCNTRLYHNFGGPVDDI